MVFVLDMGLILNFLMNFISRDLDVIVVPHYYSYEQIMDLHPNGVFISNGPGDPSVYHSAIEFARNLIENNIPTMGICLGNQIIGLAAGGSSYKLKYGHRGGNKTVINLYTQRCFITSQNHGFCVKDFEQGGFKEFLRNLDDNSNEGLMHTRFPLFI